MKFQVGDLISPSYHMHTVWEVVSIIAAPKGSNEGYFCVKFWGVDDVSNLPDLLYYGRKRKRMYWWTNNEPNPSLVDNVIIYEYARIPNGMLTVALASKYSPEEREQIRLWGIREDLRLHPEQFKVDDLVVKTNSSDKRVFRITTWFAHTDLSDRMYLAVPHNEGGVEQRVAHTQLKLFDESKT